MNILILGSGGREHAMAWACAQNPRCDRLIVAPGNAGTDEAFENASLDILDGARVAQFAADRGIDLVIVGPEAPLDAGVADELRDAGIAVLGPSAEAARLESSKAFAREVADAAGVPGPRWARFEDEAAARAHLAQVGAPIVVKADGLAAGKGVTVCECAEEAGAAIADLFADGPAACVLEEMMGGEEASYFALCHGTEAAFFGTAQDHKRIGEGDTGPNTGGMGAYSPAPIMDEATRAQVMDGIVLPTLREMDRRGTPFCGILYVGLMIEGGIARLVEFNVRLGDPEAQVLMMRLGGQALDAMLACAEGRLEDAALHWSDDHALTVVLAAEGYPGGHAKGAEIPGLSDLPEDSRRMVFHAGTAERDGRVVTSGGRVLTATGRAETLEEAARLAYGLADRVAWDGAVMRRDIGWRALGR